MGIAIRTSALRRQMVIRGLRASDLAKLAGVSESTVSLALAGRRISATSFAALSRALGQAQPIPGAQELLPEDPEVAIGTGGDL